MPKEMRKIFKNQLTCEIVADHVDISMTHPTVLHIKLNIILPNFRAVDGDLGEVFPHVCYS